MVFIITRNEGFRDKLMVECRRDGLHVINQFGEGAVCRAPTEHFGKRRTKSAGSFYFLISSPSSSTPFPSHKLLLPCLPHPGSLPPVSYTSSHMPHLSPSSLSDSE